MKKPFVYVNMAVTVDGKIAAADRGATALGTAADREEMDRLRAAADIVLWGGETLRASGHPARVRDPSLVEGRRRRGLSPQPANGVVTASGALPGDLRWFEAEDVPRFIFTGREGAAEARRAARGRAEVVVLGGGRIPPEEVVAFLGRRGRQRILLEGGGGLHWSFAEAGLVDALHVTLTPWLAGGERAPTLLDGPGFPPERFPRLRLEEVRRAGEELFLRYRVERD